MLVKFEQRGVVGIISLSDMPRRNALSNQLISDFIATLERSKSLGVRAVVIASTEKAFCAGADLKDILDTGWLTSVAASPGLITPLKLFEALQRDTRPIIAAVGGLALGGGIEMLLCCDLVVASTDASFAFPEVGLGVIPNTALALLPTMVGRRAAAELILTRRRFHADEAYRLGLVGEIVPTAELLDRSIMLAQGIVEQAPPAAIAAVKQALAQAVDWGSIRRLLALMSEDEWKEGLGAFRDKKAASYERFWTAVRQGEHQ
jgi:enoyl-CoA hydratase/carnithine racemase